MLAVPPSAFVPYHCKVWPLNEVAVNAVAGAFSQYATSETMGAEGIAGCTLINTFADATETHPDALVTVYVYVPAASNDIVVLVPVPVVVMPPGILVNVHVPEDGKPPKATFPVAILHVVCVIAPMIGAAGVDNEVLIITLADAGDAHPDVLVTAYV